MTAKCMIGMQFAKLCSQGMGGSFQITLHLVELISKASPLPYFPG